MSKHVAAHVSQSQYEVWKQEADEMEVSSMSEYVKMMAEAGRKKFSHRDLEPDETRAELRQQRSDLQRELRRARERINELEAQLSETERSKIIEYVEDNPGSQKEQIVHHLLDEGAGRITRLLAHMEGAELRIDEKGRYYAGERAGER